MPKPKASVILRFTNRSEHRVRNLMTLIRQISKNPKVEIIVSCMDKNVTYPADILELKSKNENKALLIHNFDKRSFASTTANNIGASLSNTDIIIFQDADIMFDIDTYNTIISKVEEGWEAVRVGEDCLNLSHENSAILHKKYEKKWGEQPIKHFLKMKEQSGGACCRDSPGACTALSKSAFIQIGGWCELFQVYGWEDCYFRHKTNKSLKKICLNKPIIHLAHEENYQSGHQQENAPIYGQLVSAGDKEYESILERDRKALKETYPGLFK